MNDTIAAISTALGNGAISIIRVSGKEAIKIVNYLFKGKDLNKVSSHTINYGHIVSGDLIIDEVLVSIFKAPKTFTCEDIVEINSHGGSAPTNKILELLLINGCRLAEPGEFTKRAFLNGRIDLVEAEGVMDLINSKTEKAGLLAFNTSSGKISALVKKIRDEILHTLAHIEVNIDYPEYEDILELTTLDLIPKIDFIETEIGKILKESKNGKIIKEGINVVILGKPNVGKSSLLNKLLDEEKAIVTDVAGTTRDIVEGVINLDGILLNIIDTAGIRETKDKIEQIGVRKSFDCLEKADLVLFMLNNNEVLTEEDKKLYDKIKEKDYLILINKIDLENNLDKNLFAEEKIIYLSLLNNDGIDNLKEKIKELFNIEKLNNEDLTYVSSTRIVVILTKVMALIKDIKKGINNQLPVDMIEIDIKNIWNLLGQIIGESYDDELLDKLFSKFCLGK